MFVDGDETAGGADLARRPRGDVALVVGRVAGEVDLRAHERERRALGAHQLGVAQLALGGQLLLDRLHHLVGGALATPDRLRRVATTGEERGRSEREGGADDDRDSARRPPFPHTVLPQTKASPRCTSLARSCEDATTRTTAPAVTRSSVSRVPVEAVTTTATRKTGMESPSRQTTPADSGPMR